MANIENNKGAILSTVLIYFSIAAIGLASENISYRVRVVDIKGHPVVGAEVAALETIYDLANGKVCNELLEKKVTGQDGTVQLNIVSYRNGLYIVARKNTYAFGWDYFHQLSMPLDGSELTILLDKPCMLSGKVVDETGTAVIGAKVRAEFASDYIERLFNVSAPVEWFTAITDAQGIFTFDNVPPDASADFLVTAPGKASIWTFEATDNIPGYRYAAGKTDIRIVLPDEGIIKGQVVDPAGKPVGGIMLLTRPNTKAANYHCINRTGSEKDGSFIFRNVQADTYSLQVAAPTGKMAEWVARDIRIVVKKGQTLDGVIVKVRKGGFIDFVLRDSATKKAATGVFVLLGCLIAPQLGDPLFQGIFTYIQEFQGYISPGILAAFVFGMVFKRTPALAGVAGLVLTVPVYGFLQWQFGGIAFLNRMAITFAIILVVMYVITMLKPLPAPRVLPERDDFDMRPTPAVKILGAGVIVATIILYIIFW